MKTKLLLLNLALIVLGFSASAQNSGVPDYMLANQLQLMLGKVGLPVDSAAVYIKGFKKLPATKPTETVFSSNITDGVFITFETNEAGRIQLILATMPASFLSTVKKFIEGMGMLATGTAAPPGYTAYATPKYAAFINPQVKDGVLSLVMMQGGH